MKRGALVGVALGAAMSAIVACASQAPRSASMPVTAAPPPTSAGVMPGDAHDRITALSQEIAGERQKLGLPEPAEAPQAPPDGDCKPTCVIEQMAVKPHAEDATCHPAQTQACGDTCTLSDSICHDADEICGLARQLATDPWAAGKCKDAQTSCSAAHDRCCGCQ
jgi:hypothetical protein|nr:hypothetical protein [Kofleriaceae bacterium]